MLIKNIESKKLAIIVKYSSLLSSIMTKMDISDLGDFIFDE